MTGAVPLLLMRIPLQGATQQSELILPLVCWVPNPTEEQIVHYLWRRSKWTIQTQWIVPLCVVTLSGLTAGHTFAEQPTHHFIDFKEVQDLFCLIATSVSCKWVALEVWPALEVWQAWLTNYGMWPQHAEQPKNCQIEPKHVLQTNDHRPVVQKTTQLKTLFSCHYTRHHHPSCKRQPKRQKAQCSKGKPSTLTCRRQPKWGQRAEKACFLPSSSL